MIRRAASPSRKLLMGAGRKIVNNIVARKRRVQRRRLNGGNAASRCRESCR